MTSTLVPTRGGFTQFAFDNFLSTRDEPAWLTDMRRAAWRRFQELPMPSVRDEEWMRTDIRLFKLDRFNLPESDGHAASLIDVPHALLAANVELGGSAVSMNSHGVTTELDLSLASKGVLFGSLAKLVRDHGDLLRPFFERRVVDPYKDKFAALNAACWSGGTLLYVPKNVRLELPLHSLSAMTTGGVDLGKTLVIVEPGAEATMLTETASATLESTGLHCGSIELIIEQGALLRYVNLQNWGHEVWHFAHQKAHVGREGRLQWTIGALGSRLAKVNQHVAITGPDAEVQVNGVMFTEGRQHLSYNTHQHHQAPYGKSDLLYKAALQDRSRTVWRGMIKVDKDAQRTNAYQRNDNLMLSRDARADSIPGLEIEADDVRCTHGSTSGRVDDQQVFYAMTRGYTRREAVRMIVAGFFQQIFDRITIESVRDALGEAIGRRVSDIKEFAAP
jgi:Fe-S cluster assembly protein SufD